MEHDDAPLEPAPLNARKIVAERKEKFSLMRALLSRWVARHGNDSPDLAEKTLTVLDHK